MRYQPAREKQVNATSIIEANTKAHTVDGYTAAHMVAAAHERSIRLLCAELATLRGEGQTPSVGCKHITLPLGDTSALVEWTLDSDDVVEIKGAFVNGHWITGRDDAFSSDLLSYWALEIEATIPRNLDAPIDRSDELHDMRRDAALVD